MSQYEVYDGPTDPHSGGFSGDAAYDPSDRYDRHSAGAVVLAKVPDLNEASEPSTIALCQTGATPRGSTSGLSSRSMVTIGVLMLLAGVAGFMIGRSGRPASNDDAEVWRPVPPAASAPEAPAWNGGNAVGSQAPCASSDFTLPGFSSPQPAVAMPAAPAGSLDATSTPSQAVPKSTPWSYPGTTNVPAVGQTQTEANRGMTLEAPSAPTSDDRGTQYRSGYGPGATNDPRMASRPQARTLPAPPAPKAELPHFTREAGQNPFPATPAPSYPQTVYPDTRSQPSYPDTRSIPNSTPYPVYPNTNPSTAPR